MAFGALASGAQAELIVSFHEGAPKDRFRLENTGSCTLRDSYVLLDLTSSQGRVVFDVTAAGQGVEVFQPFEVIEGAASLRSVPIVLDGQTEIMFDIAELAPSEAITFTIDVDDTLGRRETTVIGAEIEGARVTLAQQGQLAQAVFSKEARATLPMSEC